MGLDMYLVAKKFFWSIEESKEEKTQEETIKTLFPEMEGNNLEYVIFEVGYWRKANAIHKWFVDNVQEGNDDCKNYYVERKQLEELKSACEDVIKSLKTSPREKIKTVCGWHTNEKGERVTNYQEIEVFTQIETIEQLLPTSSDFSFGGTEYDTYYFEDLEKTIIIINKVLKLSDGWEFEYHSSW